MKVARTYTLDHEIVERLTNTNASDLINRLLREHFEAYSPKNTILDEKQAVIKQILKKKDLFLKRLRLLRSGKLSGLIDFLKYGLNHVKKSLLFLKLRLISKIENSKAQQKSLKEAGN